MTKTTPVWSKKVQKKMIDKNINKKQLAKEIGCNYNQLVNVMSGLVYNEKIIKAVCTYFGMEA